MATNAVPMFMGSVWMCPSCSIRSTLPSDTDAPAPTPELGRGSYVRIMDLDAWGVVKRVTRAGEFVVEYFRDGRTRIAYRGRTGLRSA